MARQRTTKQEEKTQEKLDKETVRKLWLEFVQTRDEGIREQLILNYLHLVKYVVGRVAAGVPNHVRAEDMYSTGVMGLVKAIERYDPSRANKFETYAILLIKGAIIDEMRSLDWVPRSVHQKANEVAKVQNELEQKLGREATDQEVATALGLSKNAYDELLHRIRPAVLMPLDTEVSPDDEGTVLAERIPDPKVTTSFENVERKEFRQKLEQAVLEMPEQERMVLVLYYYENLMLKEIGKIMGVSESRISQIHTKAVLRLRGRLQAFVTEFADMA